METSGWFGVRRVFKFDGYEQAVYEERVTVWRAARSVHGVPGHAGSRSVRLTP